MNPGYGYGTMGQRFAENGHGFSVGPLAFFGFLLIAAAIVALIVWAIARRSARMHGPAGTSLPAAPAAEDAAIAIARERLAKGEIDPDQYAAVVAALKG